MAAVPWARRRPALTDGSFGPMLISMSDGSIARRRVLVGGLMLALTAVGGRTAAGASKPTISVHKSPT